MGLAAAVLLAEGFEEIETATPIDVLRRAGFSVTVIGVTGDGTEPITGAHGLAYRPDAELRGDMNFDVVVFPGGMPGAGHLGNSQPAKELAMRTANAGKVLAAICAGPVMTLGAWGLLDGRTATCYPGMESKFPAGVRFSPERVVVDGKVITSRGPGTALEFSLAIVREVLGRETADKLKGEMLAG